MEDFLSKATERIAHHSCPSVGTHGCLEWQGAKTRNGGYGRLVLGVPGGGKKEFRVHRLQYMVMNRILEIPRTDENGSLLDVSHLCHNSVCVTPEHLILELHSKNMERRSCKAQGLCTKNHTPHCLL